MITLRQAGVGAIAVGATLLAYVVAPAFTVDALSCVGAGSIGYWAVYTFGGDPA